MEESYEALQCSLKFVRTILHPVYLFFSPGRKLNTDVEIVKNQTTEKTKRKRERQKNVDIGKVVQISTEGNRDFLFKWFEGLLI